MNPGTPALQWPMGLSAMDVARLDQEAVSRGLPRWLVQAIIRKETEATWPDGSLYAWRAESGYRWVVDVRSGRPFRAVTAAERASKTAPPDFGFWPRISSRDTEWWGQRSSWGAMQIMGAAAREQGFHGAFPELCTWRGILYGMIHLAWLRRRFLNSHGWGGVVAAFNAGSPRRLSNGQWENQAYVDGVARFAGTTL